MKKYEKGYKVVLALAGFSLIAPMPSTAAFTSIQTLSSTAKALTGAGATSMSIAIKKVADNSADTAVNWSAVTLPGNWKVADDYIALTANITQAGGGIQTYTDNTANDASPKFTGDKAVQTPAGVINATDPTKKLPTAWSIRHSTGTIAAVDPNANAGESFLWFFHLDKAQVAIPSANATAWVDGDPYVTAQNTTGIHFASGPTQFGAPATNAGLPDGQNNIYLEANFSGALGATTYQTTTVRLEAFTQ
jgi:hypothetical protein